MDKQQGTAKMLTTKVLNKEIKTQIAKFENHFDCPVEAKTKKTKEGWLVKFQLDHRVVETEISPTDSEEFYIEKKNGYRTYYRGLSKDISFVVEMSLNDIMRM